MLNKTEIIWRHLLVEAMEHENRRSSISELAKRFDMAVSTVHRALVVPRAMGAIEPLRSGLVLRDPMRLLLHWAGTRRFAHDRPLKVHTGLSVVAIQDRLPQGTVVTGAAAYSRRFSNDVADYSTVYCYHADPVEVLNVVPDKVGEPDLVVLEPDPFLSDYGSVASVPQTYVDLFVTSGWQAQRFLHRMNELLDVASAA
jgi:hypothetical protein